VGSTNRNKLVPLIKVFVSLNGFPRKRALQLFIKKSFTESYENLTGDLTAEIRSRTAEGHVLHIRRFFS
jgi:hypothetical protein